MEATIKIEITHVCSGYFYRGDKRYRKEFGHWVEPCRNGKLVDTVWCESYNELRQTVYNKYGIELPADKSSLPWMNWGSPHNSARL